MSIKDALRECRDLLRTDPAIISFFSAYETPVSWLIGYQSPNAAKVPQVCLLPIGTKNGQNFWVNDATVSVIVQLLEPEFTDGESNGVIKSLDIAELIKHRLQSGHSGDNTIYQVPMAVHTDRAAQHPFYEIEIVLNLLSSAV